MRDPKRDRAVALVEALRARGHEAFWAGGCVRDLVMGRAPKDYDIATSATPDQVAGLFPRSVPVGAQFGVVVVVTPEGEYEVATFRTESGYADGRRPDRIAWADAQADVARRDFTVNGMLYDPAQDRVIDWVGGREDLARGIIRSIGNPRERFGEDRLRLLRAVRFAARLHFAIDPDTWEALREAAAEITVVSAERVHQELGKLLTEGGAAEGLRLLARSGLARWVLPEVTDLESVAARFEGLAPPSAALGWGLCLADVAGSVEGLAERLRWSRRLTQEVGQGLESVAELQGYQGLPGVAAKKRALRRPGAGLAFELLARLDRPALAMPLADLARWRGALRPSPLLTGKDLAAAGYPPGPRYAVVLEALETAQLEERLPDQEAAWQLVRALYADAAG